MNGLVKVLADSASAFDRAGMFKEADVVDDMLFSLAAETPAAALATPLTARQLLSKANQLLAPLTPPDVGSSVALKTVKDYLGRLDATVTAVFQTKRSGEPVRAMAKDVLKSFLNISNSQNRASNDMFQPVVKPMVDVLQAIIRLPDQQIIA